MARRHLQEKVPAEKRGQENAIGLARGPGHIPAGEHMEMQVLHRLAGRIDDMMHYKCGDMEAGAILFSKEYGYLCETKDAAALLRRIKED